MARSPCPHITTVGPSGSVVGRLGERAEFDHARRRVGARRAYSRALADVEDPASVQLVGSDQRGCWRPVVPAAVQAAMPPASSPTMLS